LILAESDGSPQSSAASRSPTSLAAFALCLLPIGILVEEAWPLVGANGLGCGR